MDIFLFSSICRKVTNLVSWELLDRTSRVTQHEALAWVCHYALHPFGGLRPASTLQPREISIAS